MPLPSDAKIIRNTIIFPAAIDPDAAKIIRRLKRHGHVAYLVGGCVRDMLLGALPKDFDVATSARPRQIRRLFRNSKIIGRRFKLAHILFRDKFIEVSTFRRVPPEDSKHFKSEGLLILRDNVYGEPWDDARRRDFTVNSLFYDVDEHVVIDYTEGYEDLQKRILRTIGDPDVRLPEDPVRILRAIKFSCRLDLAIDPGNAVAMRAHVSELSKSSAPRVKEEIVRLMTCGASSKALRMLFDLDVPGIIFPELKAYLDRPAAFYGSELPGTEFVTRLAGALDGLDRGRRLYSDALFLAVLFSHYAGAAVTEAFESGHAPHDRPAFIDGVLRPIVMRMGISKKDLARVKQIINAFTRFERKKWRGRPRPREFVRRDYFPESLEFYRIVALGLERDLHHYHRWMHRWREQARAGEPVAPMPLEGKEGRPKSSRSRRRKRPSKKRGRRRSPRQPRQGGGAPSS